MPTIFKIIKWNGLISICPNCLNGVLRTGKEILICGRCGCDFTAGDLQGEFEF